MTAEKRSTNCGLIALIGRPNAGKSTLLNSLVGQKIAAVSAKQQTTRHRIVGLSIVGDTQLVFLDTPGIHSGASMSSLNRLMVDAAWATSADADVCCYLVDLSEGMQFEDRAYLKRVISKGVKSLWLVGSKGDTLDAGRRNSAELKLKEDFREVLLNSEPPAGTMPQVMTIFASAKIPHQVSRLRKMLAETMPEGPWLYDADQITDRPTSFVVSELIREQAFRSLSEELPYRLTVVVRGISYEGDLPQINASIIVGQESHKGMVIGAGGQTIKRIGTAARPQIEELLGQKVFLSLKVEVDRAWYDRPDSLKKYLGEEFTPV
jgi:GTP-binding protein Era